MTAIVGLVDAGHAWIAGDTGCFRGWSRHTIGGTGKIFRNKECVIGLAGRAVDAQLIEHVLVPPAVEDLELKQWAITEFVPALREVLKDNGRLEVKNGIERGDSLFMLGIRDRLFQVGEDFYVSERVHGFDAVGCGEEYALGSLHANTLSENGTAVVPPAITRLENALQAAAYFSAGVHPPFTYASTTGESGTL